MIMRSKKRRERKDEKGENCGMGRGKQSARRVFSMQSPFLKAKYLE